MRTFEIDWLSLADWEKRGRLFGELSMFDAGGLPGVAMEYRPRGVEWARLRTLWLRLPPHPHVLQAIEPLGEDGVRLGYAAIDWDGRTEITAVRCAGWAMQIAEAFRMIVSEVREADLRHFGNPIAYCDIGGAMRLAFRPPNPAAVGPRDERQLVYVIGSLLRSMMRTAPPPMHTVLGTCTHPTPENRYRSLSLLVQTCRHELAIDQAVRAGGLLAAWQHAERGLGFLALNDPERAHAEFITALRYDDYKGLARWGCDSALRRRQEARRWQSPGSFA